MVTVGNDKLIVYPQIGKKQLFDLQADPLEMNDLSDDPKQQANISKLMAKLKELQQTVGDELELRN